MTDDRALVHGLADAYGRGARAYAEVLDPTLEQMARDTIEIAGVSGAQHLLDIATGTGALARAAARAGAHVVAVDLSLGMVATARRVSAPPIGLAVADAAALPVRTHAFDVVTCGLSLSHFTQAGRVLAEVHGALRAGGTLVASSWGTSGSDRAYSAAFAVYKRNTGDLPRPFSTLLDEATWSQAERALPVIAAAGFVSAEVITRRVVGTYATPRAALDWAFGWPLTAAGIECLEPARRELLRRDALAAVEAEGQLQWERSVHYYRARV